LVAALSRDKALSAVFAPQYGIPEVYDNLEAVQHGPRLDAVIVASPDAVHDPPVLTAA
jgi:predicted dehydrogenase